MNVLSRPRFPARSLYLSQIENGLWGSLQDRAWYYSNEECRILFN